MHLDSLKHFPIEFVYAVLAVFGGITRYLNGYVNGERFSFKIFLASAAVAGFSGYMFALMGTSLNLPAPLPTLMAGTGGFFGEQSMKLIMEYLTGKLPKK